MRIMEGVEELGPYPSVVPEGLDYIPPFIPEGLRDSIVCNPCNGPMYWTGEVEQWACPTCPNKKTLIKRVTAKERAEQLGQYGGGGIDWSDWKVWFGLSVVGAALWFMYSDYIWERRSRKSYRKLPKGF
jgi:hypothetical protein